MKIVSYYIPDFDQYTFEELFELGQHHPGYSLICIACIASETYFFAVVPDVKATVSKAAVAASMAEDYDASIIASVIDHMDDWVN